MVAQGYIRAADQIAGKIKPCGAAPVTAACVQTYLQAELPLALKRPVTADEITKLMAIYKLGVPDGAQRALNLVMEAALGVGSIPLSNRSRNRCDARSPGSVRPHPVRARLGGELRADRFSARPRALEDRGRWLDHAARVLSAQVDRLLTQPAAQANLLKKVSYYLNMEKIPVAKKDMAVFPQFTATLQTSLYDSAQKFLNEWSGAASSATFSRQQVLREQRDRDGVQHRRRDRHAARQGRPSRPSAMLAFYRSPVSWRRRTSTPAPTTSCTAGCGSTTHSPAASRSARLLPAPTRSSRRSPAPSGSEPRSATLWRSAGPATRRFDPFGMVEREFRPDRPLPDDRSRRHAAGREQRARSRAIGADIDGPVSSLKEIGDKLVAGRRAPDCAAVHLAKFTLDHNPDVENSCQIQGIKDNFAKSGKFVDLFKAIVTSPAFLTRDLGVKQ